MKRKIFLATGLLCFVSILSCDKTKRTEYTINYNLSQDSLKTASRPESKMEDGKLHLYTSILDEGDAIYRTTIYYGLFNNKDENMAVVRIFEEDSTQFSSMPSKKLHITFEGDITKISKNYGEIAKKILALARQDLSLLKAEGVKKTEEW